MARRKSKNANPLARGKDKTKTKVKIIYPKKTDGGNVKWGEEWIWEDEVDNRLSEIKN